ncbi:type II toxin-antitoxin system VapB family antitoxin [Nitrospira sp. Nam80]
MRVVINDELVKEVVSTTGLAIERVVEEWLRLLIKLNKQQGIRRLKGKTAWQGILMKCVIAA